MKKNIWIWLVTLATLVVTGCAQSQPASNTAPVADPLTTAHTEFVAQFEKCESNVKDCNAVDRDVVIEGAITRVHGTDLVDISNDQGIPTTIPILSNSQDWRSTVLVNQSWERISIEDVSVWDTIRADVRAFDRIENGQLIEKLGQYGFIQVSKE